MRKQVIVLTLLLAEGYSQSTIAERTCVEQTDCPGQNAVFPLKQAICMPDGNGDMKCACLAQMNDFAVAVEEYEENGVKYNEHCKFLSGCEVYERDNGECRHNSHCEQGATTGCVCDNGHEDDPDDDTHHDCIRINLCDRANPLDNYDCGQIADSECVVIEEAGQCTCSNGYDPYALDERDSTYVEYTSSEYFLNTKDIVCAPQLPCITFTCDAADNKVCLTDSENGLPTAFCQCSTGYHDLTDDDNRVTAVNTADLTCADIDECSDESLNTCALTEKCVNNAGSYTCICTDGFIANTDAQTSGLIPCVEAPTTTVAVTIPTEPATVPTEPATIPTEPATAPTTAATAPATIPTEPATVPTTAATAPATVPTKPATVPTTAATAPATVPTKPATVPTEPATVPTTAETAPATVPTKPATVPTTAATAPATVPTKPATVTTAPATAPTKPVTMPTEPVTATKPTEPVTMPTKPVTMPTKPVTMPTKPVTATMPVVTTTRNTPRPTSTSGSFLRGPNKLTFGHAKQFCADNDMMLPLPTNYRDNTLLTEIGSTWIDIIVNDLLQSETYTNFESRQRGYLQTDGEWAIRHAFDVAPFFCIKPELEPSCGNMFVGQPTLFGAGTWSKMNNVGQMKMFNDNTAQAMGPVMIGSVFNFRCPRQKANANWNKRFDSSFSCVRQGNAAIFIRCNNRKCTKFSRQEFRDFSVFRC